MTSTPSTSPSAEPPTARSDRQGPAQAPDGPSGDVRSVDDLPTATPTDGLDADDDAVVDRASALARETVDGLRPRLLAGAGRSRRHDKQDGSPVTDVDLAVDALLVAAVADAFPDHGVVSEEGDTTWDGSPWTWVIDPIDGTTNYAAGLPWWCVSIALAHDGEVVWGLVDAPTLDRRWEARRGAGTTVGGQPAHVATAPDLSERASRHHPIAVTPGTIRRWQGGTWFKARVVGSSALELALVADGSLTGAYQRVPKAWDVAAGAILVREAGGAVVAVDGPGHFPLQAGRDYRDASVVTAAGPDHAWAVDLADRLWPQD